MRFTLEDKLEKRIITPNVGNVYPVRGGSGAKHGHMFVIVSIKNDGVTVLTIDKDGDIVTGSSYGVHYFEDKCPIAYCSGLDVLNFKIETI